MAAQVADLSKEMAHKAHVAALNRDYVVEPHLGAPPARRDRAAGGAPAASALRARHHRPMHQLLALPAPPPAPAPTTTHAPAASHDSPAPAARRPQSTAPWRA